MNLTPEEKKLGKQNFDEAVGTTRRTFLQNIGIIGGTAAAVGLGAKYFNYGPKLDDRLRVGIIGTGDEGNVLHRGAEPGLHRRRRGCGYPPVQPAPGVSRRLVFAQCACGPAGLAARSTDYKNEDEARKHVKVYENDYNELLDDPNVEAVIIATPLFMHHPMAIAAMRKGKHVL